VEIAKEKQKCPDLTFRFFAGHCTIHRNVQLLGWALLAEVHAETVSSLDYIAMHNQVIVVMHNHIVTIMRDDYVIYCNAA